MNSAKEIVKEIKALMKDGTNINDQISMSNHLLDKQVDYTLCVRYYRPIELIIFSSPSLNLSLPDFLVYAGERMNMDYVDIIFGKYNKIRLNQFIDLLTEESIHQLKNIISKIDAKSIIYHVNEVDKSFIIQTNNNFHFIDENWQI